MADARRHRAGGATSRFGNPYRIGMTVPDDWTVGPGVHVASREFRVGRDVTVLNDARPVAGVGYLPVNATSPAAASSGLNELQPTSTAALDAARVATRNARLTTWRRVSP